MTIRHLSLKFTNKNSDLYFYFTLQNIYKSPLLFVKCVHGLQL